VRTVQAHALITNWTLRRPKQFGASWPGQMSAGILRRATGEAMRPPLKPSLLGTVPGRGHREIKRGRLADRSSYVLSELDVTGESWLKPITES